MINLVLVKRDMLRYVQIGEKPRGFIDLEKVYDRVKYGSFVASVKNV